MSSKVKVWELRFEPRSLWAKDISSESSLGVSQVKKMWEHSRKRGWHVWSLQTETCSKVSSFQPYISLFNNRGHGLHCRKWGSRMWAICLVIFPYKFLIMALSLFLTLGWFSFSGTKGKCFQVSMQKAKGLKGCGLFSAFLKNKNSTFDIKTVQGTPRIAKSMPPQATSPRAPNLAALGRREGWWVRRSSQMGEIIGRKSTPALHINKNVFFPSASVKYLVISQPIFKLSNND